MYDIQSWTNRSDFAKSSEPLGTTSVFACPKHADRDTHNNQGVVQRSSKPVAFVLLVTNLAAIYEYCSKMI